MILLHAGHDATALIEALSRHWPVQVVSASSASEAYKEITSWQYLADDKLYFYPDFAYPSAYLFKDGAQEVDYRILEAKLLDYPIIYLPPIDPAVKLRYHNWTYLTMSKVIQLEVKSPYVPSDLKRIAKKLGLPNANRIG